MIVDDDPEIREVIDEYLSSRGLKVFSAKDGEEMKKILADNHVDLVLLDITLPTENGIELTHYLKARENIAIIIVTGHTDTEDRVLGLESGADDYVTKPFNLRELLARVNSVLRRGALQRPASENANSNKIVRFGKWTFNIQEQTLSSDDGENIELSAGEMDLLNIFTSKANEPVSRDELLEKTSHQSRGAYDRSIDVRVTRLRQKLEVDPSKPKIIRTVRTVGYTLISNSIES